MKHSGLYKQNPIKHIESVIFDMDGVIIDSERFWAQAEKEVFTSLGVVMKDEDCYKTKSMTTREVTQFWYDRHPWKNKPLEAVENKVIDRVGELIKNEGEPINGIEKVIVELYHAGFKIGLATNSPHKLISLVLDKLGLKSYFDSFSSSEEVGRGKPHPDVYLYAASKLNSEPESCIAVEDSISGISAAKNAGLKTILILTESKDILNKQVTADYSIMDCSQITAVLTNLNNSSN